MAADGTEPIEDDELLLRRIPVQPKYYDPALDSKPTPLAFRPRESDTTGLSLSRAKHVASYSDVATNLRGKRYYIAVLRAGDLRTRGIRVEPRPLPGNTAHAEIPDLRYDNRGTDKAESWQVQLAMELCHEVQGPFPEDQSWQENVR